MQYPPSANQTNYLNSVSDERGSWQEPRSFFLNKYQGIYLGLSLHFLHAILAQAEIHTRCSYEYLPLFTRTKVGAGMVQRLIIALCKQSDLEEGAEIS